MKSERFESTDIFKSAFLLCRGARLLDVRKQQHRRQILSFVLEGFELKQLDSEYRQGVALVNPVTLREAVNHLRDILFAKKREGRTRYGRKTKDRAHQKKR